MSISNLNRTWCEFVLEVILSPKTAEKLKQEDVNKYAEAYDRRALAKHLCYNETNNKYKDIIKKNENWLKNIGEKIGLNAAHNVNDCELSILGRMEQIIKNFCNDCPDAEDKAKAEEYLEKFIRFKNNVATDNNNECISSRQLLDKLRNSRLADCRNDIRNYFAEHHIELDRFNAAKLSQKGYDEKCYRPWLKNNPNLQTYWATPYDNYIKYGWQLVLWNRSEKSLTLLIIPAGKLNNSNFKKYDKTPAERFDIELKEENGKYTDMLSGVDFTPYLQWVADLKNDTVKSCKE